MSEIKDGVLEYQAQSPDEEALTSAARNFGFVFKVSDFGSSREFGDNVEGFKKLLFS